MTIAIVGLLLWYWPLEDPKMIGIVSGLLTGLVLFLIAMLTQVVLFRELERYRKMGIVDLLDNRHDKEYYAPILGKARSSVKVIGSSASRFLADFLDEAADKHVLLDLLRSNKSFIVKLLIPDDDHLSEASGRNWENKSALVGALTREFGKRFQVRRFPDMAHHSFIIVDDDGQFIGGPVLDTESRHGPAIHLEGTTTYARKHNSYFDSLWSQVG